MSRPFKIKIIQDDTCCKANVQLLDSKTWINGFTVYVENGNVKVKMPWGLEGKWRYSDLPYSEIEKKIIDNAIKKTVKVCVNRIDEKHYTADVTLPVTGTLIRNFSIHTDKGQLLISNPCEIWSNDEIAYDKIEDSIKYLCISELAKVTFAMTDLNGYSASFSISEMGIQERNIKVKRNENGFIGVNLAKYRNDSWNYPDCPWRLVESVIRSKFQKFLNIRQKNPSLNESVDLDEADLRKMCCSFDGKKLKYEEREIEILLTATGEKYTAYYTAHDGCIRYDKDGRSNYNADKLNEIIQREYARQILGEDVSSAYADMQAEIRFGEPYTVYSCEVYVDFPESDYRGEELIYQIKDFSETGGRDIVSPQIKRKIVNLQQLYEILKEKYRSKKSELVFEESVMKASNVSETVKENNELNKMEIAAFSFQPQTILRLEKFIDTGRAGDDKSVDDASGRANIGVGNRTKQVAFALNNGTEKGGIGMMEINMLSWIRRLNYVTDTMLMWILKLGFISKGWHNIASFSNLNKIIRQMSDLDLIDITRFVKVDDRGDLIKCNRNARIISVGTTGRVLLRQFESDIVRMDYRSIMQPGNAVKRYLAANLWLLYWLRTYKDEIGENYETSYVAMQKGAEVSTKARLYASVAINAMTLIAEPVRRSENFEISARNEEHKRKLKRIMDLYKDPEQIYVENQKITFENRPIIVLVCEDEQHIREVWEYVKECLEDDPDQTIWFTADLWLYGDDNCGNRFFQFENNELVRADLQKYLGVDKEGSPDLCTAGKA